jgi:hypothetical protein
MLKIGITLGLTQENESMWINGIKLNAILLANALNAIGKYEVYIVDTSMKVEDLTKVRWDYKKFPVIKFAQAVKDIDLMITLGTSFSSETIDAFRKLGPNKKLVKYMCGNSYVIEMERAIFTHGDKDPGLAPWDPGADEVWYVPQQGYQNHHYYKTIFRNDKVYPVPFVWDPMFLNEEVQIYKQLGRKLPIYNTNVPQDQKKLSVFEPNLNVVKYAMIPILAAEEVYRRDVDFNKMYIASGKKLLENKYFMSMVKTLDCVKDDPSNPKLQFTSRYPVCHYLSETTDIVVSHQWENPLNYSYLDVMYLGYPLVHNADMIQDAGYYYPDFNIEEAANQIQYALQHHDQNTEEYNRRNKEVLNRYTIKNQAMLDTYEKLIENLYGANHEMSHEYDWKTNLYK